MFLHSVAGSSKAGSAPGNILLHPVKKLIYTTHVCIFKSRLLSANWCLIIKLLKRNEEYQRHQGFLCQNLSITCIFHLKIAEFKQMWTNLPSVIWIKSVTSCFNRSNSVLLSSSQLQRIFSICESCKTAVYVKIRKKVAFFAIMAIWITMAKA